MNKKGFTLVELLAVIAILAILVIIALPNIMSLFNEAKKNSFTTEIKMIVKTAQQQWINDSMYETEYKIYSKCGDGCKNPLKMSGRKEIDYYIKINKAGNIVKFEATDGTYQYEYVGNDLKIEDIDNVVQISSISQDDILTISGSIAKFVTRQIPDKITSGDELTIADENFYVVSSDENETILLTKYAIITTLNSQSSVLLNTDKVVFSETGYWDNCNYSYDGNSWNCSGTSGIKNTYGTRYNNPYPYVYDSNSLLYSYINAYTNKISNATDVRVTGRLLSYEEANTMHTSTNLYAKNALKSSDYWLGSARDNKVLYCYWPHGVFSSGNFFSANFLRPVIIVSTSDL